MHCVGDRFDWDWTKQRMKIFRPIKIVFNFQLSAMSDAQSLPSFESSPNKAPNTKAQPTCLAFQWIERVHCAFCWFRLIPAGRKNWPLTESTHRNEWLSIWWVISHNKFTTHTIAPALTVEAHKSLTRKLARTIVIVFSPGLFLPRSLCCCCGCSCSWLWILPFPFGEKKSHNNHSICV